MSTTSNLKRDTTGRSIGRTVLSMGFVGSGILHFVAPKFYVKIVPPSLPVPLQLVYISGVCEILGGLGLLVPRARRLAAIGLVALLVAVFPANVYHATGNVQVGNLSTGRLYHVVRLPLQAVFIWAVLWACQEQP